MKTLNQKELEQVAGGYRWSDFRKDWKDFWEEMGKGFSKAGDDISTGCSPWQLNQSRFN